VNFGYIDCMSVMSGYLTDTVTVKGNTLALNGDVINGRTSGPADV